ncbi:hypothetical protein ACQQ2N_16380 [Dokdonella sp. MW10]|uniref:hypothetical protein n=1 Tax=Dokdonella sp. MW10 TaxID=2992926 RepID=UPI003F7F2556
MAFRHTVLISLLALGAAACSREQPPALPGQAQQPATTPAPAAAPPPPPLPAPVAEPAPQVAEAPPPPLDEQLAAFEPTGYPVCDEFFENARQCINTRISPDERSVQGPELRKSVQLVSDSIKRDSKPERIEQTCKRLRVLAQRKLADKGCAAI